MVPVPYNITQVINQLHLIIEQSIARGEREGYFAALYLRVVTAVKKKVDERHFDDNERMEQLDIIFANRYFNAYDQYKNNRPCSSSWRVAFDACRHRQPLVIQHLLAAMNAHIGFDLGIAAATVCPGFAINSLRNDFIKINDILASLVDSIESELEEMWPILKPIDWIAGKLDEDIAAFSMQIAREAAWQMALEYSSLPPGGQARFLSMRDAKVAAFGKKITEPGILLSSAISVLGLFERGSVARKIRELNDQRIPRQRKIRKASDILQEQTSTGSDAVLTGR
ncbi:hypothetical protein WSM22_31750 [Cytophagales bacterium WSM2-2]|nr:hypothetical protein WSM22_31750 [Cytophagales bacterium WSM2-2]